MGKVLFIEMPFGSTCYPSLGISLLKSHLAEEHIPSDIRYFSIDFSQMIGLKTYEQICGSHNQYLLLGERLFARELFGDNLPGNTEYLAHLKARGFASEYVAYLESLLPLSNVIPAYLDHCMTSVPWDSYAVIAFTTRFEQSLASLALAQRIKERDSTKTIVFGGANCEEEMGLELHHRFPFIDFICSGEGDYSFPELVKRLRAGEPVSDIPGIVYRDNGVTVATGGRRMVEDLDSLPYPDYDDFYGQIGTTRLQTSNPSTWMISGMPMETSRGCWWGATHHCRFCGMNAETLAFRHKSPRRVVDEFVHLTEKYGQSHVSMVDNALSMSYFSELLPVLRDLRLPVTIFYEIKANVTKEQVRSLAEAGVFYIQPGIESLSTPILKLMNKGITALQNVRFLKYCREFGISPMWGIITGFPKETDEDYRRMIALIRTITHLPPPGAAFPVSLQRFSPYFVSPEHYGIENVRPTGAYRFIYPFEEEVVMKLAYYFDFDYRADVRPAAGAIKELDEALKHWCQCYLDNEYLESFSGPGDELIIRDGRSGAVVRQVSIPSFQRDIYEFCDDIRSFPDIFFHVRDRHGSLPIRERDVHDFLNEMLAYNYMAHENERYLSLAVPSNGGTAQG